MWNVLCGFGGYFCGIVITLLVCVAVTLSERKKMLVLTRKDEPGSDTIVIQIDRNMLTEDITEIRVKIVEIRRNSVRLGIDADPDINVAREEVLVSTSLSSVFQDAIE